MRAQQAVWVGRQVYQKLPVDLARIVGDSVSRKSRTDSATMTL